MAATGKKNEIIVSGAQRTLNVINGLGKRTDDRMVSIRKDRYVTGTPF